jgi:hypothetical protein
MFDTHAMTILFIGRLCEETVPPARRLGAEPAP